MSIVRKSLALLAMLGLAACGGSGQSGAGAAAAGEAQALDDAAEMLEQQRLPDDALRPPAPPEQQAAPN